MTPVIQEETTGCGIAASATLAGISYQKARDTANAMGIYASDRTLWSDTTYVRRLLTALGIETAPSEQPFTAWEALPDRALLAIKWRMKDERSFWHWTVFVREGGDHMVLDSKAGLKQNVRRDFGRMKPRWFIEVLA